MKRLLVILFLIPSLAFGAYTEFYCNASTGDNLNSGAGGTNDYTTAGGNWAQTTRTFTVTDGTNPSSKITAGDFCSVYVTSGATVATFVGRVNTVQNATNGTVVFTTAFMGANPVNGTGTMTLKHGGFWKGPNAAVAFPFDRAQIGTAMDSSGDQVRINMNNTASYSNTSNVTFNGTGVFTVQGYTTNVGDGGRAIFTNSATGVGGTQYTLSGSNSPVMWVDIIWVNTGGSNSATLVSASTAGYLFVRNTFHGARNQGVVTSSQMTFYECEWYGNNVSNTASSGGLYINGIGVLCVNCFIHDQSNGSGVFVNAGNVILVNSIIANNPTDGVLVSTSTAGSGAQTINCDLYNNTSDGFARSSATVNAPDLIVNTNFIKNGGKGINISGTTQDGGLTYNNGYGSGTQANGGADVLGSIQHTVTDITFASGVTPYVAPTTGNFSNNLAAAQGVGRSAFTETDGTNSGTVGYPDLGAAQAQIGTAFPTPTATPTVTPTSTPTPTATATATATVTPTPTAPIEQSYVYPN